MTNGIQVGDFVRIPGTGILGKVIAIDDHPFEYAEIKIEFVYAGGTASTWASARLAQKWMSPAQARFLDTEGDV